MSLLVTIKDNNVLHVVESTATGSLSMVSLLANSQVEICNVFVVYSRRSETPENLSQYFDKKVSLIEVPMGLNRLGSSVYSLRRVIREKNITTIFLHSSIAGFVGRLASFKMGCNVFYIPHCISLMRADIGPFKRYIFSFLENFANRLPSTYLAVSNSELEAIHENIKNVKAHLVKNAIDVDYWFDESKLLSDRRPVVITVGQIRIQKSPEMFALIAKRCRSIVDNNVEFVWVGDGDVGLKNYLEASGVKVLGWREKSFIRSKLQNSYIYLSTSSWEGLPVSVLEAILCGCYVVARNTAGNNDVIEEGRNGYLFDDLDSACRIISDLLSDNSSSNSRSTLLSNAASTCKLEYNSSTYCQAVNNFAGLYSSDKNL